MSWEGNWLTKFQLPQWTWNIFSSPRKLYTGIISIRKSIKRGATRCIGAQAFILWCGSGIPVRVLGNFLHSQGINAISEKYMMDTYPPHSFILLARNLPARHTITILFYHKNSAWSQAAAGPDPGHMNSISDYKQSKQGRLVYPDHCSHREVSKDPWKLGFMAW